MKLSIFTSMTDPESRMDPYKEALECYEDFADEIIIVGEDWPDEFSFDYIGKTFQEGFDKSTGDWVIRMDIDTFFHEKSKDFLISSLKENSDVPGLVFPKLQIFTPDRGHLKAKMCIAFNKKKYPNIKLNGGGDMCDPTLDDVLLDQYNLPNKKITIWNYDSVFKNKNIISKDRARFARAWNREFGNFGDRGGPTDEEAFTAWYNMVKTRYPFHTSTVAISKHPKFIQQKLYNLTPKQFGYDLFGLTNYVSFNFLNKSWGVSADS
mgnify:CR=1 FL=1